MKLLQILKNIKAGYRLKASGICHNVYHADPVNQGKNLSKLESLWVNWPEYSGSLSYPVPYYRWLFEDGDAHDKYSKTMSYWNPFTKYGRSRRRLLDWLIKELENEENNITS